MPLRLRQIPENDKVNHHLIMHAFQDCYPPEVIGMVLSDCDAWEQHERQLNMATIIYLIMALSSFRRKQWWHQDVHLKGLSLSQIFLI
jgi:hypothetical protein